MRELLVEHPFFADLDSETLDLLAGCARNERIGAGARILHEGDPANSFYAIREGKIALGSYVPGRGFTTVSTIGAGEVLGWSWLFPPYKWHFDAEAREDVSALSLDGACLRAKCDADPKLGYHLSQRFAKVMEARLGITLALLVDIYHS